MRKIILSGKEAMGAIKKGVDMAVDPIKSSIGPLGRTAIIAQSFVSDYNVNNGHVLVTKDGWRISQCIASDDAVTQVGISLVQEACRKQMAEVGDATSTSALFTQVLLIGGLKLIEEGANHVQVVKGINAAVEYVVEELKKMSTPIDGDVEKIRQVATVCSNNDELIGNLIAQAFEKIGADGVIKINESKGRETTIDIQKGITFPCGWASQYFIPQGSSKPECVLENPYILIYDRPITQLNDTQFGSGIMPLIQRHLENNNIKHAASPRPLLILCDKIDGEALATMTFNNSHPQGFKCCAVELAMLGDKKREFMEDIAAATGGTFVNELKGIKLENVQNEHLGQATKVVVGKDDTVVIGGIKDEERFNKLSDSLKEQELEIEEGEEKELMRKRIARLNGSIAILSVGGTTEVEMKERLDRIDDAERATRSAIQEGVVIGGGMAFRKIAEIANKGKPDTISFDKSMDLIIAALNAPLRQICENAGVDATDIFRKLDGEVGNMGYNAKTGVIEDLVLSGIIEPVKSNRCALQNAASVVGQILNSNFMIVDTL